jgi:choline kinase
MIEIGGRTLLTRLVETLSPHVQSVHVVVGYREEMVIEHCARHHRNVVLVRNPDYRTTTTAHSYALGAAHLSGKVLFLDGDLLLSGSSIAAFIGAAAQHEILVGLTDAKSENAVLTQCVAQGDTLQIELFSRKLKSPYEWANVVAGPSRLLDGADGYVFERLVKHLPLSGRMIELAEVDTAADLDAARKSGLAT